MRIDSGGTPQLPPGGSWHGGAVTEGHDIEEAVFMATELVLLSSGPGRVLERLPLNFARRFVAGESSRSIKSDPQFIAMREYVLSRVFEQREAFS